jgi:hypothetical protein
VLPSSVVLVHTGPQQGLGEAGAQRADSRTVLVAMEGLAMQGVSCLESLRLSFQVACLRCTQSIEVTFGTVEVTQVRSDLTRLKNRKPGASTDRVSCFVVVVSGWLYLPEQH